MRKKRVFFDFAAGTPLDPRVFKVMKPYFKEHFHNPSALYREALHVRKAIEHARGVLADILACRPHELFIVDGATEANNIAIQGIVRTWQEKNQEPPHLITTAIEHPSVLEVYKQLERAGIAVTYLPVLDNGIVELAQLKQALQENTILVSIGYVNGEIGTIQDIPGCAKVIRHHRKKNNSVFPYFHTDAVQAINYLELITPAKLGVDLMTFNGSKIYGPKKIAGLFIKTGVSMSPLVYGGNQENNLRAGTENVPSYIGLAEALKRTRDLREYEAHRLRALQTLLTQELRDAFPDIIINAEHAAKAPHIVSVSFPVISHEELLLRLDAAGILCSAKSACKSGEEGDSHVIVALRKGTGGPTGSLRFSFGRGTRTSDIHYLLSQLKPIVAMLYQTHTNYFAKK